ncbi:peroxide stress protein YaaA [Sphingomonas abietis]|uniref:UPF0246 protein PBT88_12365 n=1 Tax=Sphingomonas abietis TaxID=3012344 RepID=A0ABY7NK40_9SPHN|nr:peroxide stress protein YaaA [Sphingomonas abietis]WBO20998.1 peroxide stress protein YaaA [Sphingomonas abietis]
MLALLSPAKTLDFASPLPAIEATVPRFADEAARLAARAATLSKQKLGEIMAISDKLATLNIERYRGFLDQPERPALYAFAGDVYTGLEAHSLDEPAIAFAQDHVRILSGLYGLLRPLDAIRPYRLEMGTRWAPGRAKNLYGHWQDRISALLADDLAADGSGVIVNLASKEYWEAVERHPVEGAQVYTIEFMEERPKGLTFNSFGAKKARGMMARFLCEHRLSDVEALKSFDSDGYAFDAAGSGDRRWLFVKR